MGGPNRATVEAPGADQRGVSDRCICLNPGKRSSLGCGFRFRASWDDAKVSTNLVSCHLGFSDLPCQKAKSDDGSTPQRIDKVVVSPQDCIPGARTEMSVACRSSRKILVHLNLSGFQAARPIGEPVLEGDKMSENWRISRSKVVWLQPSANVGKI